MPQLRKMSHALVGDLLAVEAVVLRHDATGGKGTALFCHPLDMATQFDLLGKQFVAGTAVALALIAGLSAATWMFFKAEEARANEATSVCACEASVRPGAKGTFTAWPALAK